MKDSDDIRSEEAPLLLGRTRARARNEVVQLVIRLGERRKTGVCLLLLSLFAMISIFADVLASDLPLVGSFRGHVYVMPALTRPAALRDVGGIHGMRATAQPGDWMIPPLVPIGPSEVAPTGKVRPTLAPSKEHWLGTDVFGRDVFARLVHGTRTSFVLALAAAALFVAIGATLGALSGVFGGALDAVGTRAVESITAFPPLILVLVVQAIVERPTAKTLLFAFALTRWTDVARLVRAEVLATTQRDFVVAARAIGASSWRILWTHVLPHARTPMLVAATLGVAQIVLLEAAVDFLGVGIPAPTPSWGEMLGEARRSPAAWWLLVFPGILLFLTVASFNLLGEAIRDLFDPHLRMVDLPPSEFSPSPAVESVRRPHA